jgi:hypothetical protein
MLKTLYLWENLPLKSTHNVALVITLLFIKVIKTFLRKPRLKICITHKIKTESVFAFRFFIDEKIVSLQMNPK